MGWGTCFGFFREGFFSRITRGRISDILITDSLILLFSSPLLNPLHISGE